MTKRLDMRRLQPPRTPNWHFAAPEGYCETATPQEIAPVFPVSSQVLWDRLLAVIGREPRVTIHDQDKDASFLEFTQRSLVFRFPDRVTVQLLPGPTINQSTLAIFSRAKYGRRDFGVNQTRVKRILAALAV